MKLLRHIIGFAVGITFFAVLIPMGVYYISGGIDSWLGFERFDDAWARLIVAVPLLVVGIFFVVWSNLFLVFRGRGGPADGFGVAISPRTERLVTTGPYRFTRNPMVFGALTAYYSIVVYLGSIGGLTILILFSIIIPIYLKKVEEPRLLTDFGGQYEEYRKRVAMIVPMTKISKKSN